MIHGSISDQRDIFFKMEFIHFGIGLIQNHGIHLAGLLVALFIQELCSLLAL
jgi:hypothetical protein